MKVREIALAIKGRVSGDKNLEIKGISGLENGKPGDIIFLADAKFLELAKKSRASCIVTKESLCIKGKTLIYAENPALCFIKITKLFQETVKLEPGVSQSALVGENSKIDRTAYIGPYVIIGSGVRIGKNVQVGAFSYIDNNTSIGDKTIVKTRVTILMDTTIGKRVIIHPGAVIGSDGYAYVTEGKKHHKIPQIGKVIIEDDCEIGSNVTIDRASFGETLIKRGTKIDNLVQIGHNVTIDENGLIIAQVGIAGSCKIGKNVILAGQVGVADHLKIGDGAVVAAQSGVTKNIPPNSIFSGYPARDHGLARRIYAASLRLPELLKRVKKLERIFDEIEKQDNQQSKKI